MMKTAKRFFILAAWMVVALQVNYAQTTHDAGVTQILSIPQYPLEGQTIPFQVVVVNFGSDTIYAMQIAYEVNNAPPVMIPWSGVLPPLMSDTVAMPPFVAPAGYAQLCARTILTGDSIYWNDESCHNFYAMPILDAAVINVQLPASGCNLGLDTVVIWVQNRGIDSINYPLLNGATVSYQIDGSPTVVTEPFNIVLSVFDSVPFFFTTLANFGVTTQTDTIKITAWINLPGDNVSSNDTAFGQVISVHTPAAPFVYDTIIPYGTSVTLPAVSPYVVRWYSTDTSTVLLHTGATYTTPILIDTTTYWVESVAGLPGGSSYPNGCPGTRVPLNVFIIPLPACDAGVINIASPGAMVPAGTPVPVWVRVMNFGTDPIAAGTLSVSYQLNNDPPVTVPYPGSMMPFSIDSILLPAATLQAGANTLSAYTILACDSNPFNDTMYINLFGHLSTTIPYFDDFEGGNFWYTSPNATNWELGVPSGSIINTAYSPTNAWVTNLSGQYTNNADEYLYSPMFNFTGLTGMDTVTLSFYHYVATQWGDYGRVQYSINGGQTWANLGFFGDMMGTNWYNVTSGGLHYFNYLNAGWMQSTYRLPPNTFNGQTQVQFRFHFYSTPTVVSEGWAIDNFSLTFPPPNVVVVSDMLFPVHDTVPGTPIYPVVRLHNQSTTTFTMMPLEVRINGMLVNSEVWTGLLQPGDSTIYSFIIPYTVPAGPYQLCITTVMFPTPPVNTGYCRHFAGLPIPPNHGYLYGLLNTPTGAAGPSEVWLIQYDSLTGILSALDTVLSQDSAGVTTYHFPQVPPGNYLVKAALLPSNPGYATNIPSYHQSSLFWHQADTVQVTAGNFHQASVQFVQGVNPGGPGFIGGLVTQGANKGPGDPLQGVLILLLDELNGGQPVAYDFTDHNGEFAFHNIPLGTYQVYAEVYGKITTPPVVSIDQNNPVNTKVQIVVGSSIVFYIDPLTELHTGFVGTPYPNPVSDLCHLPVSFRENTTLTATVSDLTGRRIFSEEHRLTPEQAEVVMDLSWLPAGIYFLTARTEGGFETTKKIVKHRR